MVGGATDRVAPNVGFGNARAVTSTARAAALSARASATRAPVASAARFRLGAGHRQLRAYVVRRDGEEHAESGRVACAEEKLSYHVSEVSGSTCHDDDTDGRGVAPSVIGRGNSTVAPCPVPPATRA